MGHILRRIRKLCEKIPGMQSFIECGCYHKDAEKSNLING
jgi:hypothetical protein